MATLELEGLSKVFPAVGEDIVAVDDVDLQMDDGEFVVLVGPSGSGKSTILRMIAGLESPTSGQIRIGDRDVTGVKSKNRDIAMVFQNYALYPHLTAGGNMAFGLKMQGDLSRDEIDDRVRDAADIMDIEDLLDKMPRELSGGQKQRVALGRAIVRDPQVFLMDEPLSNLDAKLRTQMRTEIQRLQAELGVTTVYVTHDQTEAMTMGDRIAILHNGQLQQFDTPVNCYYEPENRFVAGFIGSPSMNFVDVHAEWADDSLSLDHPEFSYPASEQLADRLAGAADELVLGIRPEDIEIADGDAESVVEVSIDVVEPLGKEQLVYFDIGGRTYTASISSQRAIRPDDRVALRFPEHLVYVFVRATGKTIKPQDQEEEDDRRHGEITADHE